MGISVITSHARTKEELLDEIINFVNDIRQEMADAAPRQTLKRDRMSRKFAEQILEQRIVKALKNLQFEN